MTISGKADTALVMRSGSDTEMSSIMNRDEARVTDVEDRPHQRSLARLSELFVVINLQAVDGYRRQRSPAGSRAGRLRRSRGHPARPGPTL
jgi:hypothetical protein